MLETPHVAVGIAIASKFPNPWVAIPLAFASHFVLDKVPHWNPHLYTETQKTGKPSKQSTIIGLTDILVSLSLGTFFALKSLPDAALASLILACSLASVLSDVVKYPYYFFHFRQKLLVAWVKFERSIQVDTKQVLPGIVTQLLVVIASLWWIL